MNETFQQEKLVKTPGTALHRQLYLVLREQIMLGVYAPGALLPNEDELCGYFGVSKITVRRALSDLKQQGLVERQQGRGTFVSTKLPDAHPFHATNFLEAIKERGRETQVHVLDIKTAIPPGAVALQMQMHSGEQAIYAARLRHVQEVPLMVTEAWVPIALGKTVTLARLKRKPLYQILIDQGVEFGRVIEEITAVSANPQFSKLLQAEVGAPLLRVTRLVYDRQERPVEHLTIHANPERSRVLLNLPSSEMQQSISSRIVHDRSIA
ncbi:GntR family transcriptional regulator [Candidimonas nitroreducens]|uniref:GntR family transcriptional regulator n=1 Tax=Candidimonas nitroreducens TaxID=683354 RepID=A0A225MZ47_9BURK|nr:GntR family transcriptional regulator [Candidimonas nitroreducens]OWT63959.1 GntR family transcriptional regulator [Candidimonas nitroreducens]